MRATRLPGSSGRPSSSMQGTRTKCFVSSETYPSALNASRGKVFLLGVNKLHTTATANKEGKVRNELMLLKPNFSNIDIRRTTSEALKTLPIEHSKEKGNVRDQSALSKACDRLVDDLNIQKKTRLRKNPPVFSDLPEQMQNQRYVVLSNIHHWVNYDNVSSELFKSMKPTQTQKSESQVANILQENLVELFSVMGDQKIEITEDTVGNMIQFIGKQKDGCSQMLAFIENLKRINYKLDITLFNRMMITLAFRLDPEEVRKVFKRMLDEEIAPDSLAFNTLATAYACAPKFGHPKQPLPGEVRKIVRFMKESSINRDPEIYKLALIDEISSFKPKLFRINQILTEMKEDGFEPSSDLFTLALRGFGSAIPQKPRALLSFVKQHEKNIPVNAETYELILEAIYTTGDVRTVFSLYREMQQSKMHISTRAYKMILKSLALADDDPVDSVGILKDMKERKISLSSKEYHYAMEHLIMHGQYAKIFDIYKMMQAEGVKPDYATYSDLLIVGAAISLEKCLEIFFAMKMDKHELVSEDYNLVISTLKDEGTPAAARSMAAVVQSMLEDEVLPDAATWNLIVNCPYFSGLQEMEESDNLEEQTHLLPQDISTLVSHIQECLSFGAESDIPIQVHDESSLWMGKYSTLL